MPKKKQLKYIVYSIKYINQNIMITFILKMVKWLNNEKREVILKIWNYIPRLQQDYMRSLFSFWTNFQIKSQMPGAYGWRKQTCDNQNKYGKQDYNDEMIIFEMSYGYYFRKHFSFLFHKHYNCPLTKNLNPSYNFYIY